MHDERKLASKLIKKNIEQDTLAVQNYILFACSQYQINVHIGEWELGILAYKPRHTFDQHLSLFQGEWANSRPNR